MSVKDGEKTSLSKNHSREKLQMSGRCRWGDFRDDEYDEVLGFTAPWKACRVDSVYLFSIKKCH